MRCRIEFPVRGSLLLQANAAIPHQGILFEFGLDPQGLVKAVALTVPVPDKAEWPKIIADPRPGVRAEVSCIPTNALTYARLNLSTLQGILGMFGVDAIDTDQYFLKWLPESEEEERALEVNTFRVNAGRRPSLPPLAFDLVARAVMSVDRLFDLEPILNLFRRARIHTENRDYLDTIRALYFVLEALAGNGKWRKKEVKRELEQCARLRAAFHKSLTESGYERIPGHPEADKWRDVADRFRKAGYAAFVAEIVDLRGSIQHSKPRGSAWHPERQESFLGVAIFLQDVVFTFLFDHVKEHLWHEEVLKTWEALRTHLNSMIANRPGP